MIYPITILSDRYGGCYSGGNYTAWNLNPHQIPSEVFDSDIECACFWSETDITKIGLGQTPNDAVIDLYKKLNKEYQDEKDHRI